jgi:murein DD-endopeptidase MepM/ murein hydrolase activator NlpD
MDVILVKKTQKGHHIHLTLSNVVPVAFISMLTIASVAYSGYNHYSDQARNRANSRTSSVQHRIASQRENAKQLALRVDALQTQANQLNKWGKRLVNQNQTAQSDFSLSWGRVIENQPNTTQRSRYTSRYSRNKSSRFSTREEIKRSIKTVSKNLLRKYRSRVQTLPGGWPLELGRVSSGFGWRGRRMHKGVDIAAPKGTPIVAVEGGIVLRSKYMRGYGRLVELKHSDLYTTRYGHNSKNLVKEGDIVNKGQVIALVGSTGRSTGPHVHFEVRQSGVAINPVMYLGAMDSFRLSENVNLTKYVKLSKR